MSDFFRSVEFVPRQGPHSAVAKTIRCLTQECSYIEERFRFHHHSYRAEPGAHERQVVAQYLAHLGYSADCVSRLPEIDVDAAYDILSELFRWDLARDEELVTEEEARSCVSSVRSDTEAWAILAYTNLVLPERRRYRLGSYQFERVVSPINIEGGAIFIGSDDIAMVWFLDDDGPTRAICDRRQRWTSPRSPTS